MVSRLGLDHRRQKDDARSFRKSQDRFQYLFGSLLTDRLAAAVTVRQTQFGVENAEIVVDFGQGGGCAPRIPQTEPLVDRNGRLQPGDGVDVGPLELMEELARIVGEGFNVLPLPLGKDGVVGERALPAAARAGDHRDPIAGDRKGDILQVVNPRSGHSDRRGERTLRRGVRSAGRAF